MTEAVSLGELLHEEALFCLTGVRNVGVPRGRLFPSGLCLSVISRVVWAWPDPLPTGLNGDGKNVQTLWWAELDRLHSMTRAHPPLGHVLILAPTENNVIHTVGRYFPILHTCTSLFETIENSVSRGNTGRYADSYILTYMCEFTIHLDRRNIVVYL